MKVKDSRGFGFFMVENAIVDNGNCSAYEIALYVLLCRYGNNPERKAFPSLNTLANKINSTKPTVIKYLKELENKNMIEIVNSKNNRNSFENNTYIIKGVVKEINEGGKRDLLGVVKEINKGSKAALPYKEQYKNNYSKNNNKKTSSPAKAGQSIPYDEIIDYLNEKSGKNFREKINKTRKVIKARWNEGFDLDDFKRVIDIKSSQWSNNEMSKYIRPVTLFGTKFESYLNENCVEKDNGYEGLVL